MDGRSTRARRQRGSINANEILASAFVLAREVSLDNLTVPVLADRLGVGVTSIYWYFRRKEELLNAMTDVLVEEYLASAPAIDYQLPWQHLLHEIFLNERIAHQNDQLLTELLWIRTSTYTREATRRLFERVEAIVARLVDAGFTPENALLVHNAASVFTRGMILHDRILHISRTPTLDDRQRSMIDWSSMPLLQSQVERHPLAGTTDEDFEFGLRRLIRGFEALLKEQRIAEPSEAAARERRAETQRLASDDRASSVLDAVIALLDTEGYEAVTIRRVAQQGRVSFTTIYRRWPTRDALIIAALQEWSDRQRHIIPSLDARMPVGQQIVAVFRAVFKPWQQHPAMLRALYRASTAPGGERLTELITGKLTLGIEQVVASLDPDLRDSIGDVLAGITYSLLARFANDDIDMPGLMATIGRTVTWLTAGYELERQPSASLSAMRAQRSEIA